MIDDLLKELRAAVGGASGLSESAKAELLQHVAAMENCAENPETAGETDGTAGAGGSGEAVEQHPLHQPLEGLMTSIEGFEASHPGITSAVNRIATALANMGI